MSNYIFDTQNKLIILKPGVESLPLLDLYSRWKEWAMEDDNLKYPPILSIVGGDVIDETTSIAPHVFIHDGYKIKPQESDHTLVVYGGVLVGDDLFSLTNSNYKIIVKLIQPVYAIGVNRTGGSSNGGGLTSQQSTMLLELYRLMGLDPTRPLFVSTNQRIVSPEIIQTIDTNSGGTTVTRTDS